VPASINTFTDTADIIILIKTMRIQIKENKFMIRKMVTIDENKCNGCGLCITGCHEGALQLVNGKAKLVSDSYCDGLGACLPACPMDAISLIEREAVPFDEEAVKERMEQLELQKAQSPNITFSCPGKASKEIKRSEATVSSVSGSVSSTISESVSELRQWPCQIKLAPINAPYFNNANLLIAADCTSYAYANFHRDFMKNKITLIGCPKLDAVDYAEKLTEILKYNNIKSVTVVRMEVPCCGGIESAVKQALKDCDKMIPWSITTISTDGEILD